MLLILVPEGYVTWYVNIKVIISKYDTRINNAVLNKLNSVG